MSQYSSMTSQLHPAEIEHHAYKGGFSKRRLSARDERWLQNAIMRAERPLDEWLLMEHLASVNMHVLQGNDLATAKRLITKSTNYVKIQRTRLTRLREMLGKLPEQKAEISS